MQGSFASPSNPVFTISALNDLLITWPMGDLRDHPLILVVPIFSRSFSALNQ
jgi:hypothetical protein